METEITDSIKGVGTPIVHLIEWDSLTACLNDKPTTPMAAVSIAAAEDKEWGDGGAIGWLGVDGYDALAEAISHGWQEGVELIRSLASEDLKAPDTLKRRRVRGAAGDEFDIHTALRGDLEHAWTASRRQPKAGAKRVTLLCEIAAAAKEKAKDLVWRGVAALKISDALEAAGYQVRIIGCSAAEGVDLAQQEGICMNVTVKDFDQPLDLSSLASALALPGFKRVYFHRHQYGRYGRTFSGLGQKSRPLLQWNYERLLKEGDVIRVPDSITSRAACVTLIDAATKALNAED